MIIETRIQEAGGDVLLVSSGAGFIEANKIQICPIKSLIVAHYSVWTLRIVIPSVREQFGKSAVTNGEY